MPIAAFPAQLGFQEGEARERQGFQRGKEVKDGKGRDSKEGKKRERREGWER